MAKEPLHLTFGPSELTRAARQEALRWQAYFSRVPLFVLTALALYGLGLGILRSTAQMDLVIQALVLIGYTVLYWLLFTLGRLLRGWFRARRARFRDGAPKSLTLNLEDRVLQIEEGSWRAHVPTNRIYTTYVTRDYVFFDCPLLPWLPLRKSAELMVFLRRLHAQAPAAPEAREKPLGKP